MGEQLLGGGIVSLPLVILPLCLELLDGGALGHWQAGFRLLTGGAAEGPGSLVADLRQDGRCGAGL